MLEDKLVAVDLLDRKIGEGYKEYIHKNRILHRAFSVFIVNGDKMLLQQRAYSKYHSGGLWANACCSHPREGEKLSDAVNRRLSEELGISLKTEELFQFVYYQEYGEVSEFEYDHVFLGEYDGDFKINRDEIERIQWVNIEQLMDDVLSAPNKYCSWFLIALPMVFKYLYEERGKTANQ